MFLPLGDAPSEPGPRPWVNYALVGANAAVYLLGLFLVRGGGAHVALTQTWGLVPAAPRLETFFTHMFLHGGFLHIAGNMLMLWVFGATVERRLGHVGYLLTYLTCGLAAALFFILLNPESTVPMVGASGAIFGIAGFYFVAFPRNGVLVLFWMFFVFTFWVPGRLFVGVLFLMDLFNMVTHYGAMEGGGTAFAAHVGGFLCGAALAVALRATRPRVERLDGETSDAEVAHAIQQAREQIEGRAYGQARHTLEAVLRENVHSQEAPEAALVLGALLYRVDGRPEAALELFKFAARLHPDPDRRHQAFQEILRIQGGA